MIKFEQCDTGSLGGREQYGERRLRAFIKDFIEGLTPEEAVSCLKEVLLMKNRPILDDILAHALMLHEADPNNCSVCGPYQGCADLFLVRAAKKGRTRRLERRKTKAKKVIQV